MTDLVSVTNFPTDAFGRVRISDPAQQFDIQNQYFIDTTTWDTGLSVNGTATLLANESSIQLSTVATTSANSSILQTKNYFRYQPGKSQLINMTFVLGNPVVNVIKRVGYFDVNNGVFFVQNGVNIGTGAGLYAFVVRSFATGSPVDTIITQANWNVDRLDGTGPSGYTLNGAVSQIFQIDLQWLGVGSVRFGFIINGSFILTHQVNNANTTETAVYMTTANLPIRYEIVNSGVGGAIATMKAICSTVITEGSEEIKKYLRFTANNGTTALTVSTRRPVLSVQPQLTFNSITNRGLLIPEIIDCVTTSTDTFFIEVVLNGTLGTGTSFGAVDATHSMANFDVGSTTISGGIIVASGYVSTVQREFDVENFLGKSAMSINAAANSADIISIVGTHVGGGSGTMVTSLTWKELK